MKISKALLGFMAALAFSSACPAQDLKTKDPSPSLAEKVDETTTFDMVVHDRRGRPVLDLTPEQFSVTDDRAVVKVTGLRLMKSDQVPDRMISLVFGQLNTAAAKNARAVANKILKMIPSSGYAVAVFGVDSRLRLIKEYSTDRTATEHAIEQVTTLEVAQWEAAAATEEKEISARATAGLNDPAPGKSTKDQAQAKMLLIALQQSQRLVQDQRATPEIAGLTALAQAQRPMDGRKAIIYFAQSGETDVNTADLLRSAAKASNEAGTSIFPIDMNAIDPAAQNKMMTAIGMGAAMTTARQNPTPTGINTPHDITPGGMVSQGGDTMGRFETDGTAGARSPLADLAENTGGSFISYGTDLKKPMQRLVSDLSTYYEVSYASNIEICDGRFRPITLKPLRSGLSLRARSGYFALPRNERSIADPMDASLLNIIRSPIAVHDVNFRTATLQLGNETDNLMSEIVVEIPIAELLVREDENTDLFSMHVTVGTQIEDAKGKVVEAFSQDIRRHGGLDSVDRVRAGFITFQRHVNLPAGDYILKTAVLDCNSQKTGTSSQPMHISSGANGEGLSDAVLVRQTDTAAANSDAGDPLRYNNARVVANLSGTIPSETRSLSLFFIVHPTRTSAEPAELSVSIAQDGKQIKRVHQQIPLDAHSGSVPVLTAVDLADLPAGRYEATVHFAQGAQVSERHVQFLKAEEKAIVATNDASILSADTHTGNAQPFAAHPTTTLTATSQPADTSALIDEARKRSLAYADKLPNFMCVEVIDRSVDHFGKGRWSHRDTIAELLRYHDSVETRTVLEVNGERSSIDASELKGAQSSGEFGVLLKAIFDPAAAATFEWKGEENWAAGPIQVFQYKVEKKNSKFSLTDNLNTQINAAFHGTVYIEGETGAVRRVTIEAEGLPAGFYIRASAIRVDYDYIAINEHDYLLPVRGEVSMRQGRHEAVMNALQFRDYRRFGSRSRVLNPAPRTSEK